MRGPRLWAYGYVDRTQPVNAESSRQQASRAIRLPTAAVPLPINLRDLPPDRRLPAALRRAWPVGRKASHTRYQKRMSRGAQGSQSLTGRGFDMDSRQLAIGHASTGPGPAAVQLPLAIQEAALRQLARTDPQFEIAVFPLVENGLLWWRLALCFPGDDRALRLVDARLRDRRWKQLNALTRFICRSCGNDRRLSVALQGIHPDMLTTKGE